MAAMDKAARDIGGEDKGRGDNGNLSGEDERTSGGRHNTPASMEETELPAP